MADRKYSKGYLTFCYPIVIPYEEIEDASCHDLDYIHPDGSVTHDYAVNVFLKNPEIRVICSDEEDQEYICKFFKKTKFTVLDGGNGDE